MHPDKAQALSKLAEVSSELSAEIERLKDEIAHPHRHGLRTSVGAFVALSFLGLGAVAVDATEVLLRRVSDTYWR